MTGDAPEPTTISLATPSRLFRHLNHDLRNVLSIISSSSDMLNQGLYGNLTPQQHQAITRIQRGSARAFKILEELSFYVKAESGEYSLAMKAFEPAQTLADLLETAQSVAEEKGLTIHIEEEAACPQHLIGDEFVVEHLIAQVVWNAISFTERGTVTIASNWMDGQWIITVRDSGPGLEPATLEHLFEPFWQGNSDRSSVPTSGSGLGLAVANAFAKILKGYLTVQASGTDGSTFVIYLPLTVPEQL